MGVSNRSLSGTGALRAALFSVAVVEVSGYNADYVRRGSVAQLSVAGGYSLKALQWNVHGQCFVPCAEAEVKDVPNCNKTYPACQNGAKQTVDGFLKDSSYDFIGLEAFNVPDYFAANAAKMANWGAVEHQCGGTLGFGVFPFDRASLIFNAERWQAIGAARGGCFEHREPLKSTAPPAKDGERNYRAFVAQAFQRKGTEDKITVLAAHFPHPQDGEFVEKFALAKEAAAAVSSAAGTHRTLLMADTNYGNPGSPKLAEPPWTLPYMASLEVARYLVDGLSHVASTDLAVDTCCYPTYWGGAVDRVLALNFTKASMETSSIFKDSHPPFAARDMHDPIVGKLTYELAPAGVQTKSSAGRGTLTASTALGLLLLLAR